VHKFGIESVEKLFSSILIKTLVNIFKERNSTKLWFLNSIEILSLMVLLYKFGLNLLENYFASVLGTFSNFLSCSKDITLKILHDK